MKASAIDISTAEKLANESRLAQTIWICDEADGWQFTHVQNALEDRPPRASNIAKARPALTVLPERWFS